MHHQAIINFHFRSVLAYATLTLGQIFLRIWIFEIRNEFAQKLRFDGEYVLDRPSTSPYQYLTHNMHALQTVPMAYQCLQKSMANYRLHNIRWNLGSASYCYSHRVRTLLRRWNMNLCWILPKWRLDGEHFHLGLIPRSSPFDHLLTQAWYFTEATKAIASVSPGHCLGALEMLQYKFAISS